MRHTIRTIIPAAFAASLALGVLAAPALAAEGGAAAGAAAGGAVGGPVGAAVGAAAGDAATGPDRRRDVVVDRPAGCSSTTVRKENDVGDSKTVTRQDCD